MYKEAIYLKKRKQIDELRNEYSVLVNTEKENYLKKLGSEVSDPRTSCIKYWTCLKRLLNKNNASIIPSILKDGLFVTDIKEKCSLFNTYFKNQCTVVDTSSILPFFEKTTNLVFNNIQINPENILILIKKIKTKKAHGHDGISANILKLCDDSIVLPLHIIYTNCLLNGYFPKKWKKANVTQVYKKKNETN